MYSSKRPVLKIPFSPFEKLIEMIAALAAIAMAWLVTQLSGLPEKIPTHFDLSGSVDAWGGKGSLFILPIISLLLYLILTLLERFPHVYNYLCEITEKNAEFQYQNARTLICWIKMSVVYCFLYLEWSTTQVALQKADRLGLGFLPIFLLVIFGGVGVCIYNMLKKDDSEF